jgi:hypothetical protein
MDGAPNVLASHTAVWTAMSWRPLLRGLPVRTAHQNGNLRIMSEGPRLRAPMPRSERWDFDAWRPRYDSPSLNESPVLSFGLVAADEDIVQRIRQISPAAGHFLSVCAGSVRRPAGGDVRSMCFFSVFVVVMVVSFRQLPSRKPADLLSLY